MNLDDIRTQIDIVDNKLSTLIEERMNLSALVAQSKLDSGDRIFKPEREQFVISRLTENYNSDIKRHYTSLIKKIMLVSREYQYRLTLDAKDDNPIIFTSGITSECSTIITSFDDELALRLSSGTEYIVNSSPNEDRTHTIALSDELIGNDSTGHILLMIAGDDYSCNLPGILNITSDYNVSLTRINSNHASCFMEFAANLIDPDIIAMLYMLLLEYDKLKIIGSY